MLINSALFWFTLCFSVSVSSIFLAFLWFALVLILVAAAAAACFPKYLGLELTCFWAIPMRGQKLDGWKWALSKGTKTKRLPTKNIFVLGQSKTLGREGWIMLFMNYFSGSLPQLKKHLEEQGSHVFSFITTELIKLACHKQKGNQRLGGFKKSHSLLGLSKKNSSFGEFKENPPPTTALQLRRQMQSSALPQKKKKRSQGFVDPNCPPEILLKRRALVLVFGASCGLKKHMLGIEKEQCFLLEQVLGGQVILEAGYNYWSILLKQAHCFIVTLE